MLTFFGACSLCSTFLPVVHGVNVFIDSPGAIELAPASWVSVLGRSFKVSFSRDNFDMTERLFNSRILGHDVTPPGSFQAWAQSYNWDLLSPSNIHTDNIKAFEKTMMPFVLMEPSHKEAINDTVPTLAPVPEACFENKHVFAGPRQKPVKMIDVFKLGYEADVLETRLWEYIDVADYVVIVECELSLLGVPKVLVWDKLRKQQRFKPFQEKVLHLVFEISEITGRKNGDKTDVQEQWAVEDREYELLKTRLPDILNKLQVNTDNVVVNYGDVDEITSRRNMHLMKHCEPRQLPVDSGIWFPMGRLDRAFSTDWPTAAGSYSFGDPTFQNLSNFVGLGRGKSGMYLLGGMHMSDYNYLPFRLMKVLSNSDADGIPDSWLHLLRRGHTQKLFDDLSNMEAPVFPASRRERIITLKALYDLSPTYKQMVYTPWFLDANPARYPLWYGQEDRRVYISPPI